MRRLIKYLSIVLMVATYAGNANAYYKEGPKSGKETKPKKPTITTKGANCAPANYYKIFDFNDVSCRLETGGLLFLDRQNNLATYTVPKTAEIKVTVIYAGALWMGGTDVNGQLKLAAVKFRQDGNDFWPGRFQ